MFKQIRQLMIIALAVPMMAMSCPDPTPAQDICRDAVGSGPMVSCLGDSNTDPWQAFPTGSWCERLTGYTTENCGYGGATAAPHPGTPPHFSGTTQLPDTAASSIVIIAFGTNDLAVLGLTPQEAFDAIVNLRNTSEAAGHTTFVATVPPRPIPGDGLAEQINALLLASSIPSDRIIDFYTGFDDLVDPDGVHFINAGHELRAARALMMLEKCTN